MSQENLDLINNMEYEEKIDIEDLFLPEIKTSGTKVSEIKEEPNLGNEFNFSTSLNDEKRENLNFEMKRDITKLFDEFDTMCLQDYDQARVQRVQDLFEIYFKEQSWLSMKLLEKQLEHKSNELIILKEQLEKSSLANSELHQRIQELEKSNKKLLDENLLQNTIQVPNTYDHKKQKSENIKLFEDKLKGQISVHDSNKLHKSNFCQLSFERSLELKKHMEFHKKSTAEYDVDNQKTISPEKLSKSKPRKYSSVTCPICNLVLSYSGSLTKHISGVHEGKRPLQCSSCKQRFATNKDMKRHTDAVHENMRPYQCSMCHKRFSLPYKLKRHVATVHEKKNPFQCQVCEKFYGAKSDLTRHMKKFHN